MDGRLGLQPGTVLEFPGMECRIESFVGRGSNAMVYLGSYPDAQLKGMRHQVLIKELFSLSREGRDLPGRESEHLPYRRGGRRVGAAPSELQPGK